MFRSPRSTAAMVENKTMVRQGDCVGNGGKLLEAYRAQNASWWDLSLFNELSVPVIGIMSVREAHGFIAITALAQLGCEAPPMMAKRPEQQNAALELSDATASIRSAAPPNVRPVFAHLAMCDSATKERPPINPPLGWVLSEATRKKFKAILRKCGNGPELTVLEQALGADVR
jgi:hypothetical protein